MKVFVRWAGHFVLVGALLTLPRAEAWSEAVDVPRSASEGPSSTVGAKDDFQFFQEEADVVSASREPVSRMQSPATVYVVTADDIKNSGAQTIWDALRNVPGVDVVQTRTDQGEVSIRGLDKPSNNRTLVLLDGKTVMDPFFDQVTWEAIPVTMQEIDRIEVVEGPASAVYGANAIAGVINIITKTPEQLQGGQLSYTGGERNTQIGSYDYGRKTGDWSYKFGGGWRSMNQFERADQFASQAGKFNAFAGMTPTSDSKFSVSGGVTDLNTQTSAGPVGDYFNKGTSSFARADYSYQKTKAWVFWNRDHINLDQMTALNNATLDSDMYNAEVTQSLSLPWRNGLVFGGSYRHTGATSSGLVPGLLTQDLWALFAEDRWDLAERWSLTASGRLDRHPFTPYMFSPRGSLLYTPVAEQVFRVSAGTSFRNPTLLENSSVVTINTPNPGTALPNPPFTTIQAQAIGNQNLSPERMETVEVAHSGQFGPLETSLVGFHYRLDQEIITDPAQTIGMTPPTLMLLSTYGNDGSVEAWGSEAGVKLRLNHWLSSFANYSYQYLHETPGDQILSLESPRHKANAGLLAQRGGLTGNLSVNWVDKTKWISVLDQPTAADLAPVSAYFLVNAHAGYAFSGPWQGLEISVTAFDLLNHDHYELLPQLSPAVPGQFGEIVRSRWTGTVAYKF